VSRPIASPAPDDPGFPNCPDPAVEQETGSHSTPEPGDMLSGTTENPVAGAERIGGFLLR
jgi:hypothetical protein